MPDEHEPTVSTEVLSALPDSLPVNIDLEGIRARMELAQTHTDEIIGGLVEIASGDMKDLLDDNGSFDYDKALRDGKTGLIKKLIERTTYGDDGSVTVRREVQLYDRLRALTQLCLVFNLKDEPRRNRAALMFQMAFEVVKRGETNGQRISFKDAMEAVRVHAEKVGM